MARMIGVFTHIKGKIGNMIYQTWHGVQVIKTMFIPDNPQSADQTAHRDIFTLLVDIGKGILDDIITVGWNPFRRGAQSGWSNWMKRNLLLQDQATLQYDGLCLSEGSIQVTPILANSFNAGTGIGTITWNTTLQNNQDADDIPMAFMINDSDDKFYYNAAQAEKRSDGTISITGSIGDTPADLHGYLWFIRKSGTKVIEVSDCSGCIGAAP